MRLNCSYISYTFPATCVHVSMFRYLVSVCIQLCSLPLYLGTSRCSLRSLSTQVEPTFMPFYSSAFWLSFLFLFAPPPRNQFGTNSPLPNQCHTLFRFHPKHVFLPLVGSSSPTPTPPPPSQHTTKWLLSWHCKYLFLFYLTKIPLTLCFLFLF